MFKTITIKNIHITICTKNMELLKLYSKEKTNFFLLNQVAIYVRYLINVNVRLEAILEGQGWYYTTLFNTICWF